MADTLVETDITSSLDQKGLFGPYWINTQEAIIVFIEGANDLHFSRTIDGGENWSTTEIVAGDVSVVACWFDQETPGDTGTEVHIAWIDGTALSTFYVNVDISDGSQGTIRTVDSSITTINVPKIAITKTVGGNLLLAYETQTEIECYRSVDDGVNWIDRADVFETANVPDYALLFPAATADDNDACAIYWDVSANEISIKMYDDSENSWTETSISGSMTDTAWYFNMDGAVRHSDSHILFAAHSNPVTVSDDLMTWDLTVDSITDPTITAKTNVFTDKTQTSQVAIIINQQNDDVYISYLGETDWLAEEDVVFYKSDDGMGSWGDEQAYSETTDDYRLVHGGRTIGDDGGRIQWSFYDDDEVDIYVNLVNDIEIAAFSQTHNLSYSDTTTLSDSISTHAIITVGISNADTTNLSDTLYFDAEQTLGVSHLDTTTLSDSKSLSIITQFTETETLSLTDDISIGAYYLETISTSDSLTLSDEVSIGADVTLSISNADTTTLTDAVSVVGNFLELISETDTTTLSDSLSIEMLKLVDVDEVLTLSDTSYIGADVTLNLSNVDTTSLSDTLSINFLLNNSYLDTTSFSDSVKINLITQFTKTEITTLIDKVYLDALQTLGVSQSDTLTLTDAVSIEGLTLIEVDEILNLTEKFSISSKFKPIGNMMPNKGEYRKTKIGRMLSPTKRLINVGVIQ